MRVDDVAVSPLYTFADGTSMATPHVAGTIALMLQARPGLTPQQVIDIVEGTADNMPAYELFEVGIGHLDAYGAVHVLCNNAGVGPPGGLVWE